MKCKNPNYIYFADCDKENKRRVRFISSKNEVDYLEKKIPNFFDHVITVPCGRCVACRLEYSRNWANRCYLESLCHEHTWFITLTYRDEELVYGSKGLPTVEKDAISGFIRKLRDKLGHKITVRYFGCAEYGEGKGERAGFNPHYHIMVFGPNLDDLTENMPDMSKDRLPSGKYPIFRRKNSNGDYVFFSQTIYDCWQKGKIEVEEASWNTAAYISRYVLKKQFGRQKEVYERLGVLPEYLRMSNRPGIGAEWLLDHKNSLLRTDYLSVKNAKGVQTSHPPRYFEKLMMRDEESLDNELMVANKCTRIVNAMKKSTEKNTGKSDKQIREDEAELLEKKTKVLQRNMQ